MGSGREDPSSIVSAATILRKEVIENIQKLVAVNLIAGAASGRKVHVDATALPP